MHKQTTSKNIIRPNKLLGQNFLRDKNILSKIVAAAQVSPHDTILEIGPGLGDLTRELIKSAGRVIAVEKDKNLAAQLKEKFKDTETVEIIAEDILKINFQKLFSRHPDPAKAGERSLIDSSPHYSGEKNNNLFSYKVVANIPYYLTSRLIRLLLESANPPQEIVLLVQKEVAQRLCAKPPHMSLLSVSVQFYADAKIIAYVKRGAFWPVPKVDSAIIKMTPHQWCHPDPAKAEEGSLPCRQAGKKDSSPEFTPRSDAGAQNDKTNNERFFRVLHAGFGAPRKQLLNNLSVGLKLDRNAAAEVIKNAGLKPTDRAATLTIEDWQNLTRAFNLNS
ncbi:MAG: 16S rRNA (adenine(1518)-N(6)/adenine(1519)-N(6))-dimethyltransferase RsmA [Patescibacteria group bacterium]